MATGQNDRQETVGASWRRFYKNQPERVLEKKLRKQARSAERRREWRAENAELSRERSKKYAAKRKQDPLKAATDRERARLKQRQYRKNDPARFAGYGLKTKLGVGIDWYNETFARQSGVCAICGKPEKGGRRLAVDHCHETGLIRELLCSACNGGLGHFYDDPTLLEAAVAYLRKHQSTEEVQCPSVALTA